MNKSMKRTRAFNSRALLPNALHASEVAKWNPQVHLTGGMEDNADVLLVKQLVTEYAPHIVAFAIFPDVAYPHMAGAFFPGMFSVELEFAAASREQMLECMNRWSAAGPQSDDDEGRR